MKTGRILVLLGVCGIVLVPVLAHETGGTPATGAGLFDPNAPKRPSAVTAAAIGLETAEVGFGPIEEFIRLGGIVRARPDKRMAVAPPVAGTLQSVLVQVGDSIKRGDLIAVVNSPQLAQMVHEQLKAEVEYEHAQSEAVSTRASLDTLGKQIVAARRQAELADEEVARLRSGADVIGANAMAQREAVAIQARSQLDGLTATLAQQTREAQSLERRAEASGKAAAAMRNVIAIVESGPLGSSASDPVERTEPAGVIELRSPLDGVVVRRAGVPGQGVEAGQTLVEVADYSQVQIDGEVPESLVDRFEPSRAAGVGAAGGASASGGEVRIRRVMEGPEIGSGRVRSGSPVIDTIKRTAHVVIDAESASGLLRDGMYVDLSVVLRSRKQAVVVPNGAVVSDGSLRFVFIKDGEAFVKRDVRTGVAGDRVVEIIDGLVPGDVVVTRGAYALSQLRPFPAPDSHDHH